MGPVLFCHALAQNFGYKGVAGQKKNEQMKRFSNHLIGIDQGDMVLFADFEDGGEMWTGTGPRERRRAVRFSETFRNWFTRRFPYGTSTPNRPFAPKSRPRTSQHRALTSCSAPGWTPASHGCGLPGWQPVNCRMKTTGSFTDTGCVWRKCPESSRERGGCCPITLPHKGFRKSG